MGKGYLGVFSSIMFLATTIWAETSIQAPKNQSSQHRGFLIALSAPSGTGKSTIAQKILATDPELVRSVSVTTRPIRPGEIDGKDYFFVDRDRFLEMDKNNEFAEKSENYGNLYGISRKFIEEKVSSGKDIILDLNWDGVQQLAGSKNKYDVVTIFILPPSLKELEKRLRNRATDKEEAILTRLSQAKSEIKHLVHYDYVVINDDIDKAKQQVKTIIDAERLKRTRQILPNYED
ncbi:MAG TPA: guanylate kinase [Candidatus Nitrosotenuis sp.]|jgi:guanylate kinase|nr:guanylate kinase [Candidatus Nitrosotenuis sp.]